jgi:hypothetical protein
MPDCAIFGKADNSTEHRSHPYKSANHETDGWSEIQPFHAEWRQQAWGECNRVGSHSAIHCCGLWALRCGFEWISVGITRPTDIAPWDPG